jgi:hypothetical protein
MVQKSPAESWDVQPADHYSPLQERIPQAINRRFLSLTPISYVSPQNWSKFDPIYHMSEKKAQMEAVCWLHVISAHK